MSAYDFDDHDRHDQDGGSLKKLLEEQYHTENSKEIKTKLIHLLDKED